MKRRRLTPEEMDLWRKVVEKTERLRPESATPAVPPPTPVARPKTPTRPVKMNGTTPRKAVTYDLVEQLSHRMKSAPVRMDQKAFKRMTRGKLSPEGRIDLHGMTLDRAHPALNRFILGASASGKRLVLVITGKGRDRDDGDPIPSRKGILRHQVPHWLSIPPLAQHVIQVTPAHISHGGDGAYYVYLKRPR